MGNTNQALADITPLPALESEESHPFVVADERLNLKDVAKEYQDQWKFLFRRRAFLNDRIQKNRNDMNWIFFGMTVCGCITAARQRNLSGGFLERLKASYESIFYVAGAAFAVDKFCLQMNQIDLANEYQEYIQKLGSAYIKADNESQLHDFKAAHLHRAYKNFLKENYDTLQRLEWRYSGTPGVRGLYYYEVAHLNREAEQAWRLIQSDQ